MLGSQVLEVAIGLVFIYLFLSVVCSAVKEWISGFLSLRGSNLQEGIKALLDEANDSGLTQQVYQHPLIKSLSKKTSKAVDDLKAKHPSYIPSECFAHALLDVVSPREGSQPHTIDKIRDSVNKIDNQQLKSALLPLLNSAESDVAKLRQNVGDWFDHGMERASGWYKRKAQMIIFLLALLVTVVANIDSIMIAKALWQSQTLRSSVVSMVEKNITESELSEEQSHALLKVQLQKLDLPIGWTHKSANIDPVPDSISGWLYKILGLLVSCIAISLGAPFWFDALNKLVNLRSTGDQPKRP